MSNTFIPWWKADVKFPKDVDPRDTVEVRYRDQEDDRGTAEEFRWSITGEDSDIVSYRVVAKFSESPAHILVTNERMRQIEEEGFGPEHDSCYENDELIRAAVCYTLAGSSYEILPLNPKTGVPFLWPWSKEWWKPRSKRENLIRAGALIMAAIDREKWYGTCTGFFCRGNSDRLHILSDV